MFTDKKHLEFYQDYMDRIEQLLKEKPLEYWIMMHKLQLKRKDVRWQADINSYPSFSSDYYSNTYIGPFLGYHYHPDPLKPIYLKNYNWIRDHINQVPLTPELIQLISRTRMGYVIYGFDSEDRMICAFDSQERMYTFEYEKNKIWIVRSFVPHPPQQKQDLLDQVFEDIYEEKHQGPELLTIAECEYDDKGRIVKYIETHFAEGDEKYRKGIIRFFDYNSYRYDNQGISEYINYWLRVHLRRKNHIIPAEILSEESLLKDHCELKKRLQRAGFSYFGSKHRFIHDEEGYITHYITSTRENKLPKGMRIKF